MTRDSIIKELEKYNRFEECIILEMEWKHYGTTLSLIFNYIWDERGSLRDNLNEEKKVTLSFELVQEFHLNNAMNEFMLAEPEKLNWGFNEVAQIKLKEQYAHPTFHHVEVRWEGERHIDIIFGKMSIVEC